MEFSDMKVAEAGPVIRYRASLKNWYAEKRADHIIGVELGEGEPIHDLGDRKLVFKQNSVFFLNRAEEYRVTCPYFGKKDTYSLSVHFTTTEPVDTKSFVFTLKNVSEPVRILEKMEISRARPNLCMSLLYELFSFADGLLTRPYSGSRKRLEDAREYMDLHFKDKDVSERAAEISGVSRRRFNDLFKSAFGETPNRYVVNARIELAKHLLAGGGVPITDVADLCGYEYFSYFCRAFGAETGLTPSEFRRLSQRKE